MGARYITALTIAGSDSIGGAGIQADLKTMSALGVYGASVITALTAQNSAGVVGIMPATVEIVEQQIDAVFSDIRPDAVKSGMLFSAEIVSAVSARLRHHQATNLVVDPVMISTSGSRLIAQDAIDTMISQLLPLATVVTPNRMEAECLAGMRISSYESLVEAGERILAKGACAVLIKGGHFHSDTMDDYLFVSAGMQPQRFSAPIVATKNTHGTGCTLSSAIASYLAMGKSLPEAVAKAKGYLTGALAAGAVVDCWLGNGSVSHLYAPNFQLIKTEE